VKTAAVVGGGVIGLSSGRALARRGYAVTVYEQFTVGTHLGSSSGASRIFRISHPEAEDVRLARRALEAWQALDPGLLMFNGLLEWGEGTEARGAALAACGEDHTWLEPAEASRLFPEARFDTPVLWHADAGVVRADVALRRLAANLDVREGVRIEDLVRLAADVVVVAAGPWLSRFVEFPLSPRFEEVAYFRGAPADRPSIIQHGELSAYGLVTPGLGFKLALDAPDEAFDPDTPERTIRADQIARIAAFARDRFPGLEPAPEHAEGCLYTLTPDEQFVLDRAGDVIVCGGDSGHGFKFGLLLGELVADLADGVELPPEARRFTLERAAGRS
jgi:sarcosine oxidase